MHPVSGITKRPFFIALLTPSACIEEFLPCIFVLILVKVLKDALQPNFQQVEDGRLRALVQDLPAVLLKSKADSTARKYEKGFNKCTRFIVFS